MLKTHNSYMLGVSYQFGIPKNPMIIIVHTCQPTTRTQKMSQLISEIHGLDFSMQ